MRDDLQKFEPPLLIVPAAGFGRRVGSPEAKEMFLRENGRRLIDGPLDFARELEWPCHVITRREKESLIKYLGFPAQATKVTVQLVEPTRDWPETILCSKSFWQEWNVLYLPDVEFSPTQILDQIKNVLVSKPDLELVVVQHEVKTQPQTWGYILPNSDGIVLAEKPTEVRSDKAWGMYAFRRSVGEKLLRAQSESNQDHEWKALNVKTEFLSFDSFKDVTR